MKFLTGSLNDISRRFGVMLMLVFAFLLSGYAPSYASIKTPISKTETISPTRFCNQSKNLFRAAGSQPARLRQSITRQSRFTNFTGSKIQLLSPEIRQSNFGSADPIQNQSNSSATSTIFTFQNLPTIPASRCETFSLTGISKTARLCSDANRATSLKNSNAPAARNLKISRSGRPIRLFKPVSSASATGRISVVLSRQKFKWRESLRRSTPGRPRFAANSTENLFASAWQTKPFSDLTNLNPANLPPNYTSQKSEKRFRESRLRLLRSS